MGVPRTIRPRSWSALGAGSPAKLNARLAAMPQCAAMAPLAVSSARPAPGDADGAKPPTLFTPITLTHLPEAPRIVPPSTWTGARRKAGQRGERWRDLPQFGRKSPARDAETIVVSGRSSNSARGGAGLPARPCQRVPATRTGMPVWRRRTRQPTSCKDAQDQPPESISGRNAADASIGFPEGREAGQSTGAPAPSRTLPRLLLRRSANKTCLPGSCFSVGIAMTPELLTWDPERPGRYSMVSIPLTLLSWRGDAQLPLHEQGRMHLCRPSLAQCTPNNRVSSEFRAPASAAAFASAAARRGPGTARIRLAKRALFLMALCKRPLRTCGGDLNRQLGAPSTLWTSKEPMAAKAARSRFPRNGANLGVGGLPGQDPGAEGWPPPPRLQDIALGAASTWSSQPSVRVQLRCMECHCSTAHARNSDAPSGLAGSSPAFAGWPARLLRRRLKSSRRQWRTFARSQLPSWPCRVCHVRQLTPCQPQMRMPSHSWGASLRRLPAAACHSGTNYQPLAPAKTSGASVDALVSARGGTDGEGWCWRRGCCGCIRAVASSGRALGVSGGRAAQTLCRRQELSGHVPDTAVGGRCLATVSRLLRGWRCRANIPTH